MSATPKSRVDDFAAHCEKQHLLLSEATVSLLTTIEETAKRHNVWLHSALVLAVCIQQTADLQRCLLRHGIDPTSAAETATRVAISDGGDNYEDGNEDAYWTDGVGNRSALGSSAILRVRSAGAKTITPTHIIGALLDSHDADTPPLRNAEWTDEGLHVPFNTLSHITGRKHQPLWLPFDTVRKELGLLTPEAMRREPIEAAPAHVRNALLSLFADHSDYNRNCFLIMPFRDCRPLSEVQQAIRSLLARHGFKVLRADDAVYSENVFTNIEAYMYGCRFAVSIIERSTSEQHNANVALEIGYMLGLKKDVCLLKEKTVPALPSDLQGRLYTEFDMFSVLPTIDTNVTRWLRDRRLVGGQRDG